MRQYSIPKIMNTKWHKLNMFGFGGYAVRKFLRLYKEKLWNKKRKTRKFVSNVSIVKKVSKCLLRRKRSYFFLLFQS